MKRIYKRGGKWILIAVVLIFLCLLTQWFIRAHTLYLPFQSKLSGGWGLISLSGHVLVDDYFPSTPSIPSEGLVRVGPGTDGLYTFYTVSRKPKQVGESYVSAQHFSEGLAATAKVNGPIVYIDRHGRPQLTLDKDPGGRLIIRAGAFSHGLAGVMNEDNKWGFVDKHGRFVVPPKYDMARNYGPGYAWVHNNVVQADGRRVAVEAILDRSGKSVLPESEQTAYGVICPGAVTYSNDLHKTWGLMSLKGKTLFAPREQFNYIQLFDHGVAVYKDSNGKYGLVNRKGEVVLPAKHDYLIYSEGILTATDGGHFSYRNRQDQALSTASYDRAYPMVHGHGLVRVGNDWQLVNRKGKVLNKVALANINTDGFEDYLGRKIGITNPTIASDIYNPEMVVGKVAADFSNTGLNGITQDIQPEDLIKLLGIDPQSYYCGTNSITFHNRRIGNIATYNIEVVYDQNLMLGPDNLPIPNAKYPESNPKVTKVTYSLNIMQQKLGKSPEIAEALKARIANAGFRPSQDPMSAGHWATSPNPMEQWFSSPNGDAHASVYQSGGFVTLTFRFWEKAE